MNGAPLTGPVLAQGERMVDADERLLARLRELEISLHDPRVRGDAWRVDALLHPDFVEIGRSGRCGSKRELLAQLAARAAASRVDGDAGPPPPRIFADDFVLRVLQPGLAMVRYRSAQVAADGTLHRYARRTSIWQWHGGHWRMAFHQGTPVEGT